MKFSIGEISGRLIKFIMGYEGFERRCKENFYAWE